MHARVAGSYAVYFRTVLTEQKGQRSSEVQVQVQSHSNWGYNFWHKHLVKSTHPYSIINNK